MPTIVIVVQVSTPENACMVVGENGIAYVWNYDMEILSSFA
jgi:hypothetical protein